MNFGRKNPCPSLIMSKYPLTFWVGVEVYRSVPFKVVICDELETETNPGIKEGGRDPTSCRTSGLIAAAVSLLSIWLFATIILLLSSPCLIIGPVDCGAPITSSTVISSLIGLVLTDIFFMGKNYSFFGEVIQILFVFNQIYDYLS